MTAAPSRPSAAPTGFGSGRANLGDVLLKTVCQAAAVSLLVLLASLVAVLTWESWPAITAIGLSFFTSTTWDPEPTHRVFGALAFVWGTVTTSALAMLIAVPLGVGTAAFLSEIAPGWLRKPASFLVEMLAAIPSVVYGFWGMQVLKPYIQTLFSGLGGPNTGGSGILPAGVVLSIMIVPYIAAVSFDVCRAVPAAQRAGALALGATRWQTIWRVVLPYARPGIIGGCFLALGRALGETMAVTMLIGNVPAIEWSLFAVGDSIASAIANQFAEATYDLHRSALVELGLVLLLVSILVNALARVLIWRVTQAEKGRPLFGWPFRGRETPASRPPDPAADEELLIPDPFAAPVATDEPPPPERRIPGKNPLALVVDRLMTGVLGLAVVVTVGALFVILGFLVVEGLSSLDLAFFINLPKPVNEKGGGMANAIYGSAMLVGLATAFAVPVGLLAAIFLAEYRSDRLGPTVRFIGELLGGVPSIVIGIYAYTVLVRPMGHFSGWAGAFALGVMMIPVVMRASEESLKLVPKSIRDASYALGASQWQTVLRVSVPAALPAIITGVFLAIARVGGETAPLLLTTLNNQYFPRSPNDFTPSLPVYVFNYAKSGYPDWNRQAWAAALVLLAGVMLLNFGIRVLTGKRVLSASRAD